jgi:hypothetical protein
MILDTVSFILSFPHKQRSQDKMIDIMQLGQQIMEYRMTTSVPASLAAEAAPFPVGGKELILFVLVKIFQGASACQFGRKSV